MHCRFGIFRSWPLWALILASAAPTARAAQVVSSLYGTVVADSNAQQAAQDAMREVLVRLTGVRDAASDPALAGLITDARRYVQLQRTTTTGTTQVLFDGSALRDAISAAGRSIWGPDRPLAWVLLPQQEPAAAETLRARLTAAALTAYVSPGDAASLQWTLVAPATEGHWAGGPELAIDGVTDALVQASRELGMAPVAEFNCHISGVADLPSFTTVLSVLHAAPEVTEVAVREVDADSVLLQVKARGNEAELEHALASDRLRAAGASTHGALEYRYQAGP